MAGNHASPARGRFDLELPARHPLSIAENGVTPNFELQDSPLGADRGSMMTTPRPSLPKIDVASAKRKSVNEGSKRPTSPHVTIATPTSARHHHAYGSASPSDLHERRSSMPASARDASSDSKARSSSSNRGPARQGSLNKASHMSRNGTEMAPGRTTPHSASATAAAAAANAAMAYVGIRPDSASAVNRRHVASPEHASDGQFPPFPAVFGDEEDDERFKGHGARRQSSIPSGRWTPTILSGLIKTSGSPVHTFNSSAGKHKLSSHDDQPATQGRKTPARYRPSEEVDEPRLGVGHTQQATTSPQFTHFQDSHPLSHAHTLSNSSASNSSHSIQMHSSPRFTSKHSRHSSILPLVPGTGPLQPSPILGSSSANTAASSPLIVPQARRGAINLRPACRKKQAAMARRRRAAAESAAQTSKRPLRVQIFSVLSFLVRAFRCPVETAHACRLYFYETAASIDRSFRDPSTGQRVWRPSWLGAYIPLLIWLVVSLSSTFTVLIWHTQVFRALDRLSAHLQGLGMTGRLILGGLIFITTFPPLPLYSTLIILCGFSFGLVQGFIISYVAALSGAVIVFLLSRSLLKGWMVELLNKSGGLKRVVRAIEKRPKLLFLVRLAPYPYNLMNTLLASSPTLTLRTYTLCTALALPKLLVHCALGTSIKNFAAYNGAAADPQAPISDPSGSASTGGQAPPMIGSDSNAYDASSSQTAERIKQLFGFVGVGLCVGIFLYLFSVARKAVDEELDDEEDLGEEYDLMLSEDDSEDLDEVKAAGEGSELDDDSLNIARGSSDSAKESSTPSLIGSLQGGGGSFTLRDGDQRIYSSDSTLADGSLQSCEQHSGLKNGPMSSPFAHQSHQTSFFTPRHQLNGTDSNPYYTSTPNNSKHSPRHYDSQTSLADSIVEMEKHAIEMEEEPLFLYSHSQTDLSSSRYAD